MDIHVDCLCVCDCHNGAWDDPRVGRVKQLKAEGKDLSVDEMHAILPSAVSFQAAMLAEVAFEAMRETPCVVCRARSRVPAAVVLPFAVSDELGGTKDISRLILYFLCRNHAKLAWTDDMDRAITATAVAHADVIRAARPEAL